MKLPSLSKFLRWAAGEEGTPPQGAAEQSGTESKSSAHSPQSGFSIEEQLPATLVWLGPDGQALRCRAPVRGAGGRTLALRLPRQVEPETLLWGLSDAGGHLAGIVGDCQRVEGGYEATVELLAAPQTAAASEDVRLGEATLVWAGRKRQLQSCFAAIGNSSDGMLTVDSPHELPSPSIVLLQGREYRCLGLARFYRKEGQRYVFEIETLSDALRSPVQAAA